MEKLFKVNMDKDKVFKYLDSAIFVFLCLMIFCLPFSKAGIESFVWPALFIYILKRVLGYRAGALWGMLPKTGLNRVLGGLIVINLLATFFSSNLDLSLRGFFGKEIKFIAIYFMLVEVIRSQNRLRTILIVIIASVMLIIADAGAQYFRGVDFLRGYVWTRLRASFSTANGFAAWLIVMIPIFLGLLAAGKTIFKGSKVLLSASIPLLILCLLATFVRGAWLGLLIGISLMCWYVFKNSTLKAKISYLSVGIGALVIFLILPQPMQAKVKAIGRIDFKLGDTVNMRIKSTLRTNEGSTAIRFSLWKEALRIIKDYNFAGCGLNTYSIVARDYKSFNLGGIYPHNSYLQMAAETGLFGLVAFIWVLFTFFKIGLCYLDQRNDFLILGFLSGILAFLVHAFFDTHLYSLQLVVLFWYMLGLTMAVIRVETDRSNPKITLS